MADLGSDGFVSASERTGPDSVRPGWTGFWQVRRWDEAEPNVPTYYVATTESWDVVKHEPGHDPHVAAHPILEIDGQTIVLKDEETPDEDAERWQVEREGDTLRAMALTGPHAGAVGVADRISTDPRVPTSDA
jgi:hypothetical protein